MPVIGFLNGRSPDGYAPMVDAFRQGLKKTGYASAIARVVCSCTTIGRADVDKCPV